MFKYEILIYWSEEDWINAPEILDMLAKREDEVAREIKEGKFITLGELQNKLGK